MKIGIVTTWFERGAAYVSKIYMELLQKEGHEVFIYARGGENHPSIKAACWNAENVTRDVAYGDGSLNIRKFSKWVKNNEIEALLFNEQHNFENVADAKKRFPNIKIGAYVDYYTENIIPWYNIYDFLICNTHRHMEAMKKHPQSFYVQWGTNVDLYQPQPTEERPLTFFHSVGMSARKGTDILVDAFIEGKCYEQSKLVIHTQIPIHTVCKYTKEELEQYNVEVIEKTVTAPGLYYMGDVYVYPTRLDGLGLTMYEALASGLPVITTNFPPMNEAVTNDIGKLVNVRDFYCRGDAYYYPMAICDTESLIESMNWYMAHPEELKEQKNKARQYAEKYYDISKKSARVSEVFAQAEIRPLDVQVYKSIKKHYGFANSDFMNKLRKSRKLRMIINKVKRG